MENKPKGFNQRGFEGRGATSSGARYIQHLAAGVTHAQHGTLGKKISSSKAIFFSAP